MTENRYASGADLGILRGGGVLGRNSSRGGGLGSRSAGIFIYWQAKKTKNLWGGGGVNPYPPPWIRYCAYSIMSIAWILPHFCYVNHFRSGLWFDKRNGTKNLVQVLRVRPTYIALVTGALFDQLNQRAKLKGIYPEFQVIRGLSQKIPADLLSYDKIQS